MNIYINRDGKQFGPYTLEDVNAYLASGELSGDDMAWYEGAANWIPLRLMEGVQAPATNPHGESSRSLPSDADSSFQMVALAKQRTNLGIAAGLCFLGVPLFDLFFAKALVVKGLFLLASCSFLFVATYRLGKGIRSGVVWLYCVLLFVPLVNLVALLVLERKARKLIKQCQVKAAQGSSTG